MGDFYQNGRVTTLHNFRTRTLEDLEDSLVGFSKKCPMTLILPSLFSELKGSALENIINEISKVSYLDEIIIGLDRADEKEFEYAKKFFSRLPQRHHILWNDGPRLKELDARLKERKIAPKEMGKGRNAWYCIGYALASGRAKAIALHDCDILTYDRWLLARLLYPIVNPDLHYIFCKGYYFRTTEQRLSGRVTRLLIGPLLKTLKTFFGAIEYLEYLDSFRYALAGNIYTAGEEFLANPMQTPFVPSWKRIMSAEPGFTDQLFEAVQLDNA